MTGVLLHLRYPLVASRQCALCQKFRYNEQTGQIERDAKGRRIRRGKRERLPCDFQQADGETACPKGTPDAVRSLTTTNREVYEHWRRSKAIGRFPEIDANTDEVIAEHAVIIEECVSLIEQQRMASMQLLLASRQR